MFSSYEYQLLDVTSKTLHKKQLQKLYKEGKIYIVKL